MKKILLHPELKHKIKDEFNCTLQTVTMSLDFVFNSEKAKKIRQRSAELLKEQIENCKQ
ncbi:hypothetical protein SAMN05444371_3424 [Epilithonimonas mollis]|uniref:Uncharacterized protein n=1 Tax=Epilithonimonas mollis TaxID=216903 RepID=A0A1M6UQV8_9FLAO|nr:hypothetical protein SAMN05444371_3424 [Epilithonimonas mollis]